MNELDEQQATNVATLPTNTEQPEMPSLSTVEAEPDGPTAPNPALTPTPAPTPAAQEPTPDPAPMATQETANDQTPLGRLQLPRDLAVQFVRKVDGVPTRFRPARPMAKECSDDDRMDVEDLLIGFIASEEKRRTDHNEKRIMTYECQPTALQARALKKMLLGKAKQMEAHLAKHGYEDRLQRTEQRLRQTYDVLQRLNTLLGTPGDDGCTLQEALGRHLGHVRRTRDDLRQFEQRVLATAETTTAGSAIAETVQLALNLISSMDRLLASTATQSANEAVAKTHTNK